MAGMLYLVPTPIGNLGDISERCRRTLEEADFIAAEDTRVSLKLLNYLGIKKSLVSYYEHNKAFKGNVILDRILAGETCALVSDAGSPAISDPGEDLVRLCAEHGIRHRHPRPLRRHHRALHLRSAHRTVLLRGLPVHRQEEPQGAPGIPGGRNQNHDLLRSPPQAGVHPGGSGRILWR